MAGLNWNGWPLSIGTGGRIRPESLAGFSRNTHLACIIYWQAREIARVTSISNHEPPAFDLDISLLEHVSPIEWDNIVLYGEYVVDRSLIR